MTASNLTNNITSKSVSQGAKTAVGWTVSIGASSHSQWLSRYNNYLAAGYTVSQAVNYANSFSYTDNGVKNAKIYGNSALRICSGSLNSVPNQVDTIPIDSEDVSIHDVIDIERV